jgi:hypothetical protein
MVGRPGYGFNTFDFSGKFHQQRRMIANNAKDEDEVRVPVSLKTDQKSWFSSEIGVHFRHFFR